MGSKKKADKKTDYKSTLPKKEAMKPKSPKAKKAEKASWKKQK